MYKIERLSNYKIKGKRYHVDETLPILGNLEDRKATIRNLTRKKQREDMSHARLDILFLLLFPLFFLIFNVIYWVSFLYVG